MGRQFIHSAIFFFTLTYRFTLVVVQDKHGKSADNNMKFIYNKCTHICACLCFGLQNDKVTQTSTGGSKGREWTLQHDGSRPSTRNFSSRFLTAGLVHVW